MPNIQLLPEIQEQGPGTGPAEFVVVVFDNSVNTFEEVIQILRLATGCSKREAEIETWEVHNLGRSVVHHGDEVECNRVAEVIRTIGIQVQVTQE